MIKIFPSSVLRLFVSVFLFSTAFGMNVVIFPAKLLENGIDAAKIGFASSIEVISGIVMSLFLARLVKKIGVSYSLLLSSISYAAAIILIFFCKNYYLWLLMVFAMGSCWIVNIVVRQAWLHNMISNESRGMAVGIYSMMISIAFGLGPILVKLFGAKNYFSFVVSAALIILSFLVLDRSKSGKKPEINSRKISFVSFLKKNPRCFLGRFFFDFLSFSILAFSVVFGRRIGLSSEDAGLLITAFMASFFFDLVTGFLLKKYDAYKLINIGFVGFLVCILIVALFHNNYFLLLAIFFIMGIFAAFIFVSIMTAVNNDYKKEDLIAANSTMQIVGSSGSLAAGLINGLMIHVFSAAGFIIAIILSCVAYLTFLVIYEKKYNSSRG